MQLIISGDDYLKLSKEQLHHTLIQSTFVISAYDNDQLIGTRRIISDGIINAYLCELVVHPSFQNRGNGKEIVQKLIVECQKQNLHLQLICTAEYIPFYEKLDFEEFAIGMKKK
ncbi:GNAT family N-acetyltransferase [Bacillus pseudomycoides]|uniref:GNAT family N-acetyltransferase n=1 Tax=Bacillus pseudomycoides TaxID=64104 RepID=UPI000BF75E73|nr:GNAT family N-acetyltransferase [Bacillus pseudomycoides]PGE97712.1 GNAT family N-acetyltransferase [Bacillus pseudomycoides]PHE36561.1 GNAT family N-acetyltransferase [Bacillus pseudomycoides]